MGRDGVWLGCRLLHRHTSPRLPEALACCQRMGFARILVFPFFLFTGRLEKRIQQLTAAFATAHPESEVLVADYLDAHPFLIQVLLERAQEAIEGHAHM